MRRFCCSLLLAASLCAPAHAADAAPAADVAAIRQVLEQFMGAIRAHDGKALGALFLTEQSSWLSVVDDKILALMKARDPAASRFRPSNWKTFADYVSSSSKPMEERFQNIRIDTNGIVGSVWFDFEFVIDGVVTNRGSETWQMVRTEQGWKISAMLYSQSR